MPPTNLVGNSEGKLLDGGDWSTTLSPPDQEVVLPPDDLPSGGVLGQGFPVLLQSGQVSTQENILKHSWQS